MWHYLFNQYEGVRENIQNFLYDFASEPSKVWVISVQCIIIVALGLFTCVMALLLPYWILYG